MIEFISIHEGEWRPPTFLMPEEYITMYFVVNLKYYLNKEDKYVKTITFNWN